MTATQTKLTEDDKKRISALALGIVGGDKSLLPPLRLLFDVGGEDILVQLNALKLGNATLRHMLRRTATAEHGIQTFVEYIRTAFIAMAASEAALPTEVKETEIMPTTHTNKEGSKLMEECAAIRISWTWMRTGKQVDDNSKSKMASAVDATIKGISTSKRLMGADHPTVKAANEVRNRAIGYIKGISLPVVKLGDNESEKKEGGLYLLRKDELSTFEERMTAFQSELRTMEERISADLGSIKAADKVRLGQLYDERDYPDTVKLGVHYYAVNLEPPKYLEKFAPKMFKAEQEKAEKWWQNVYETAAMEFMEEFKAVIASWVDALGPSVFLYPDSEHPLHRLYGCEVRARTTHQDDSSIPEGKFTVTVRYKDSSDGKKTITEILGPMDQTVYDALQPYEKVDKPRRFQNSTVENMLDMIGKFRKLGATLSSGADFTKTVNELEANIKRGGVRPEDIGEELRTSRTFRSTMHSLMQQASVKLNEQIIAKQKPRRFIDIKPDEKE